MAEYAAPPVYPPAETARFARAWRTGLLAGFVVLLLLIIFVTAIGYREMVASQARLQVISEQHMKKLELTKTMHMAARNRTMLMHQMILSDDAFVRDEQHLRFTHNAAEFGRARSALRKLDLTPEEQAKVEEQGRLTGKAVPIQLQVVDLVYADRLDEAKSILIEQAVPAQDAVLAALTALDGLSQRAAQQAVAQAAVDYRQARWWMLGLSAAALAIGILVAWLVFRQANQASRVREHLAMHDALTGLPNRRLLGDRLGQAIAHAWREQQLLGVMFIDLDNFKLVNDSLGHAAGDELIRAVAQRIRNTIRGNDTVARVGGDEFVVVAGEAAALDDLIQVAENLIATLAKAFQIAGREMYASCSIGLSVYPNDGETPETLLKNADIAMYHAKEGGKNRQQLFDAAMNSHAIKRLELETALRQGVERDEFLLYYQPQVDLRSGQVCGNEALLRWQNPQRGLVPPGEFLGLLEHSDLILEIGKHSLERACEHCRVWSAQGLPNLKVAVNASGREFWRGDLVATVARALQASGLPARQLQIELTEGILMENVDQAAERVRALKDLGVLIAVDDFGTGYSSLAHIKRFPIDVLKIDRYFVQDLLQHPSDQAIVQAIITLSDSLDIQVVAEGVEEAAQVALLQRLGCHIFQGHYISRPLPAEAMPQWLAGKGGCAAMAMQPLA